TVRISSSSGLNRRCRRGRPNRALRRSSAAATERLSWGPREGAMAPIITAGRHAWPRDARRAVPVPQSLRPRLVVRGAPAAVRLVAGADIAYDTGRDRLLAAILVFRLPALELVETSRVVRRVRFPYIPGLLSFREAPALLDAWDRLRLKPDL